MSSIKKNTLVIAAILLFVEPGFVQEKTTPSTFADAVSRTWTSLDGKYSVTGSIATLEGERLSIKCDDGKIVSITLDQLSIDDRKYVEAVRQQKFADKVDRLAAEHETQNQLDVEMMRQFGSRDRRSRNLARDIFESRNTPGNVSDVDYSAMQSIPLSSETALDTKSPIWAPKAVNKRQPFRIKDVSRTITVTSIVSSENDEWAVVSLMDPFGGDLGMGPKYGFVLVNLMNSQIAGTYVLGETSFVCGDVSNDGKSVLGYSDRMPHIPVVSIYDIGSDGLELRTSWAIGREIGFFRDVESARFLADGNVATKHKEQLVVWQLDPLAAKSKIFDEYKLKLADNIESTEQSTLEWRLARDRRHALVRGHVSSFEIDLVAGECTAKVTSNEAMSVDGNRMARADVSSLKIFSSSGELLDHFYVPGLDSSATLEWLDNQFIRAANGNTNYFIDANNRVLLDCQTDFATVRLQNRDGWGYRQGSNGLEIAQSSVFDMSLAGLLDLAKQLPKKGDALLVLNPGDEVQLVMDLRSDPNMTGEVRDRLSEILSARDVKISDRARRQLVATSQQKTETVQYEKWKGVIEKYSVQITTTFAELQLREGKDVLWRTCSSFGPGFFLEVGEGETIQQAADRESSRRRNFWSTLTFPKNVAMHPSGGAWTLPYNSGINARDALGQ